MRTAETYVRGMSHGHVDELLVLGKYNEALEVAATALRTAREGNDAASVALALLDESRAELALRDRDHAVQSVDEAISRARRGFGPKDAHYVEALELGAEIAADANMPNVAEARFRAALEILEETKITGALLLRTLFHHGVFRAAQADVAGAARAFLSVIERTPAVTDNDARSYCAMAHTALGRLALEGGKPAQSRALGDRALELWLAMGVARRVEVADSMALVGRSALAEGDADAAVAFLETASEIYGRCAGNHKSAHATAAYDLARALDAQGKKSEAHAAYLRALDMYREGDTTRLEIEQRLMDLARA